MKAVVLVGGYGTRMRPLTMTMPKQLLPLVDRPILDHVLDHLAAHGVDEVILSSPYLGQAFETYLGARTEPPRIVWLTEDEPLDTGGAIVNALGDIRGTFLVLNGDILTRLDLSAMVALHRERGATGTISLIQVTDARAFGLVEMAEDGRLSAFREKPAEAVAGLVNAGVYVLEPEALSGWRAGERVNIEREMFPLLIGRGERLYGFVSTAYWSDLGTPERYLRCTFDALEGKIEGLSYSAPHVDPTADVSIRSHLGRWVVVGPAARVEEGAEVEDSVLLGGAVVGPSAKVRESVLGPRSRIGAAAVAYRTVLADGAVVPAGSFSHGARLGPDEALGT
jgi:mannose-1-phosphate guanylyltransferase